MTYLSTLPDWISDFNGAVTVCDLEGTILAMNRKACQTFAKEGGESLIGRSLYDCHPEHARGKIRDQMSRRAVNAYTIEKNGIRKLIYQAPWYQNGEAAGLVELSLEIPAEMPHFIRGAAK